MPPLLALYEKTGGMLRDFSVQRDMLDIHDQIKAVFERGKIGALRRRREVRSAGSPSPAYM
jgi:hypothetical protein